MCIVSRIELFLTSHVHTLCYSDLGSRLNLEPIEPKLLVVVVTDQVIRASARAELSFFAGIAHLPHTFLALKLYDKVSHDSHLLGRQDIRKVEYKELTYHIHIAGAAAAVQSIRFGAAATADLAIDRWANVRRVGKAKRGNGDNDCTCETHGCCEIFGPDSVDKRRMKDDDDTV
jgi:hypothetical protein